MRKTLDDVDISHSIMVGLFICFCCFVLTVVGAFVSSVVLLVIGIVFGAFGTMFLAGCVIVSFENKTEKEGDLKHSLQLLESDIDSLDIRCNTIIFDVSRKFVGMEARLEKLEKKLAKTKKGVKNGK